MRNHNIAEYQKPCIRQSKKNYWALFWYINQLVPSCTEATVLLNVYPVFVSKFDFDCESNIRQHSSVDRRAYYNAIQNVLLFSSGFLSWIQQKESRGTDIVGLYFVNMTQLVLCCWKNCIQMLNLRVYTVYGRKISLHLVQLDLVSLGTKGNYKKGKEIFLAIVLLCILSCGWWIESGRVAAVF